MLTGVTDMFLSWKSSFEGQLVMKLMLLLRDLGKRD